MRKVYLFAALIGALAVSSCAKEVARQDEIDPTIKEEHFVGMLNGNTYGGTTKIIAGAETDKGFPCYWSKGDDLGARLEDGTRVGTATLSKGEDRTYGEFSFKVSSAPSEGTVVRLVYPSAKTSGFTSESLDSLQIQQGGTKGSCDLSPYAFAYADIEYSESAFPIGFTLNHILSYICVRISSGENAYGGAVISKMRILSGTTALTGTFSTDYSSLAVTPVKGVKEVGVSFTAPITLNDAEKDIWFTVLPGDHTGEKLTISMEGTYKNQNIVIPIEIDGIRFEQGKVAVIDYRGFSQADVLKWYEPVDGRVMAGLGYAYGPSNTFLIQCKDGSTYTGATYSASSLYSDEVTFDFRPRGDISKVSDPAEFTIGWLKPNGTLITSASASGAYVPRYTEYTASNINPTGYTFSVDRNNYTITVKNVSAHAGSPILVMRDKTGKTVWGWTFWNIAADGTELGTAPVTGNSGTFEIANMDIGQPTTDYAAFGSNKAGEYVDLVGRFINKYQWGRYLPTFWNTYASLNFSDGTQPTANIPAVKGPVTLEESLAHPYCLVTADASGKSLTDWNSSPDGSLWGNQASSYTVIGDKTNYDPCPKGWRVPSGYEMAKWKEYANKAGITFISTAGQIGFVTGGTYFAAGGQYDNAVAGTTLAVSQKGIVKGATGTNACWWGNHNYQAGGTPTIWSLQNNNTTSNPAIIHSGQAKSVSGTFEDWYHSDYAYGQRARAFSVRCTPDAMNR